MGLWDAGKEAGNRCRYDALNVVEAKLPWLCHLGCTSRHLTWSQLSMTPGTFLSNRITPWKIPLTHHTGLDSRCSAIYASNVPTALADMVIEPETFFETDNS